MPVPLSQCQYSSLEKPEPGKSCKRRNGSVLYVTEFAEEHLVETD